MAIILFELFSDNSQLDFSHLQSQQVKSPLATISSLQHAQIVILKAQTTSSNLLLSNFTSNPKPEMEEPNPCLENPKPEFLTILKETSKIPFKNIRFTCFLLFASLPLLFFMFLFELLLEKSLKEFSNVLLTAPSYLPKAKYYGFSIMYYLEEKKMELIWNSYQKWIVLSLIYLFPLHMLEFLTAFFTIDLTSKIHTDDHKCSSISIKDMILGDKGRLKGSFLTYVYVLFVLASFLFGFIGLMTNLYGFHLIFELIFLAVFTASLPKYLELIAILNTGMVASVLEEVQGIGALSYSFYLCKGKERLGRDLMLVFFVWTWGARIPCLFFDDGEIGVVWRTCLQWLGSLMKWVVCVVYCHQCKSKISCNRTDEEVGGRAQFC